MAEELLDFPSKAKELGVSEASLRARILNRDVFPYVYVSNEYAEGTQEEFLPAWTRDGFPLVRWTDHGSSIADRASEHSWRRDPASLKPGGAPRYTLNGWVILSKHATGQLLADKREVNLHGYYVGIEDSRTEEVVPLLIRGKKVWVQQDDGGYDDNRATQLTPADLYFLPEARSLETSRDLDPRREKSLLRIIRALDVMAGLPSRGAAGPIDLQLQELGFKGPNDETIRRILEEARALAPDKT